MQIERDILNQPAKLADFLQTPLEKALIIRLEAQITLLTQDLVIDLQIRTPGQAALALTIRRPRIGKIQVDAVDLGRARTNTSRSSAASKDTNRRLGSGCSSQRSAAMMSAPSSRSTAMKFTSG